MIKDAEDGLPMQGGQLSTIGQAGDEGTRVLNQEMLRMASADCGVRGWEQVPACSTIIATNDCPP
jgi:hypothetical protein